MKMTKLSNALIGLTVLCLACSKPAAEKETPNGFKFTLVEKGDGILPKPNQLIVFDYVIKDSKDSVWVDTYDTGIPGVAQIQDSSALANEFGMMQLFRMLSVRDSVHVNKSARVFFKEVIGQPLPRRIDSTLSISCNLRVREIMEMQKFAEFQEDLFKKRMTKQKAKDEKLIDEYLAKNNIKAETDTSGIRYVLKANTGGRKPTVNDCVEVRYRGRFLKNEIKFDGNDKMAFMLSRVIPGWTWSIPKLGIGDSATFYIPSHLCYGPQGRPGPGGIPPDAIMMFDITLLNVGSGYDQVNRICN